MVTQLSQDFIKIFQIEKKGFYNGGNGITIPHAHEELVLSPKICIIKLNNPIIWNEENIDLIYLALKFKDIYTTKVFFKNFYSLLDNKDMVKKIKDSNSTEEIVSIFLDLNN